MGSPSERTGHESGHRALAESGAFSRFLLPASVARVVMFSARNGTCPHGAGTFRGLAARDDYGVVKVSTCTELPAAAASPMSSGR